MEQIIAGVEPAVVQISTSRSSGSGFFFGDRGWIATNAHVVRGAKRVTILLYDGSQMQGDVVGRNGFVDLAVIQISREDSLEGLDFADSDRVRVGEDVLALGFPSGGTGGTVTVTKGIVSAKGVRPDDVEYIQTDAAINPGNSGGPLINAEGKVVGVNTLRPDQTSSGRPIQNIGFAITSNLIRDWLPSLMSGLDADTTSFTVTAGNSHEIPFDVEAGTEVRYSFNTTLNVKFRIIGPAGDIVVDRGRVERAEGMVVADVSGRYALIFDNEFSFLAAKMIELTYTIVPPR